MAIDQRQLSQVIADSWKRVCEDVEAACLRAGRSLSDITIVGVTKYVEPAWAEMLFAAGCHDLGENRPQELWRKAEWLNSHLEPPPDGNVAAEPRWHMIGHLQRNKVRRTLPWIYLLHSLDSQRLADALANQAEKANKVVRCLVEVNVTQDATKTGVPAEQLEGLVEHVLSRPRLQLEGLMAMASQAAKGDAARREFAKLRQYRDQLQDRFGITLPQLSMGMSNDFPEAILEGATLVRIGTAIWRDAFRLEQTRGSS